MGFVDRGGGRESKGGSLRRSKKNPGASAARKASAAKQPQHVTRIPPTMPSFTDKDQHIDAAVAILARKLEVDRDVLMTRASQESGVAAILTWCADFDRQEALLDYCRQHNTTITATSATRKESSSGNMYCVVGVHVNNVDRMHKKVQQNWVDNVATWGKQPVVLGVLSGLNLERDGGTHFAQEWLLEQLWYTAGALQVPLVLHICHETSINNDNDNNDEGEGEGGSSSKGITIGGTVTDCMTDSNPTVDRAADILAELMSRKDDEVNVKDDDGISQITIKKKPTAIVLYNGVGAVACSSAMRALLKRCVPSLDSTGTTREVMENADTIVPIYVIATAEGLTDGKNNHHTTDKEDTGISSCKSSFSVALRNNIALSQLLIGTGAPWNTPQNIPDEYMRTMPNEPANYRYVASAIHEVLTNGLQDHPLGIQQLYSTVRDNFLRAFFNTNTSKDQPQEEEHEQEEEEVEVEEKEKKKEENDGAEDLIGSVVVPSAPLPRVHFDPQISSTLKTVNIGANSNRYFLCFKCRRRLFDEASLLTHEPDAARVNFGNRYNRKSAGSNANQNNNNNNNNGRTNVGEACGSVWFVPVTEDVDGEWSVVGDGLVVERRSGTVHCGGCNAKIGSAGEFVCCPCGRTVAGLSARVAASKVEAPVKCVDVSSTNAPGNGSETSTVIDLNRGSGSGRQDLDELLAQAARERQQLQEEEEEDEEDDGDGMGKKRRKQPKKNVKANNRSNFTHFRNKNFAPRNQTSGETVDDIHSNRDNDSDEKDDDDDDNKQTEQFISKQQSGRRRKKQK